MSIQINKNGTWQEVSQKELLELVKNRVILQDTEIIFNGKTVVAAKVKGLTFPSDSAIPPPLPTGSTSSGILPPSPPPVLAVSDQNSPVEPESAVSPSLSEKIPLESIKQNGMRFLRWMLPILKKGGTKAMEAAKKGGELAVEATKKGAEQAIEATKKAAPHVKAQLDKIPMESLKEQATQQIDKVPAGRKRLVVIAGVVLLVLLGCYWMMRSFSRTNHGNDEKTIAEFMGNSDEQNDAGVSTDESQGGDSRLLELHVKKEMGTLSHREESELEELNKESVIKYPEPSSFAVPGGHDWGSLSFITLSPDGKFAATTGEGVVRVWDIASKKQVHDFDFDRPYHGKSPVAFSNDSKYLVAPRSGKAVVWNTSDWKIIHEFKGTAFAETSACFSPDSKYLVTGDMHNRNGGWVWDIASGKEVKHLKMAEGYDNIVSYAGFSPNGKYILISNYEQVRIWRTSTWELDEKLNSEIAKKIHIGHDIGVNCFSTGGNLFLVHDTRNPSASKVYDLETGKEFITFSRRIRPPGEVGQVDIEFLPGDKFLLVKDMDECCFWNIVSGEKEREFKGKHLFSPDKKIAINDDAKVIDVSSGKCIFTMPRTMTWANKPFFSADNRLFFMLGGNGQVYMWKVDDLKQIYQRETKRQEDIRLAVKRRIEEKQIASKKRGEEIRIAQKKRKEADSRFGVVRLVDVISQAGFEYLKSPYPNDARVKLTEALEELYNFGSSDLHNQYRRGDQFDRAELETKISENKSKMFKTAFVYDFPYYVLKNDVRIEGKKAEAILGVVLPFCAYGCNDYEYVLNPTRKDLKNISFTSVEFSEVCTLNLDRWFLTDEKKVRRCNEMEANEIIKNGGIVYYHEVPYSTTYITVSGNVDAIKKLVRNNDRFTIDVSFDGLLYQENDSWGLFERDSWLSMNRNTFVMRGPHRIGQQSDQPWYYVVSDKSPIRFAAQIRNINIVDADGNIVCQGTKKNSKK